MKELARQTARATEQISSQVDGIQQEVQGTREGLSGINETLETMQGIAAGIAERVGAQVGAVEAVDVGVEKVVGDAADIAGGLNRLMSLSTEATTSAKDAKQAAELLVTEADKLNRALESLRKRG